MPVDVDLSIMPIASQLLSPLPRTLSACLPKSTHICVNKSPNVPTHANHVDVSGEDEDDEQDSLLAEIYIEELRYKECDITFQVSIKN